MNELSTLVSNALIELRIASETINKENYKEVNSKYHILIVGKETDIINTIELYNSLNTYFKIKITAEQLNEIIPKICKSLNMEIEPLADIDDLDNPIPAVYRIILK